MTVTLTANSTISHYRIVSKIGAGGMGEVYLAQDTKLDRRVALKILPADVAAHPDRMKRFVQEARAASSLNHPNIITIHEIGETASGHFIGTEFIDGETVRERMSRGGVELSDTLDIVVQVASALTAAHGAGIVHRDIKPENIMLRRDGIVKVLDFGLAKLVEQTPLDAEAETRMQVQTQAGLIVGTVAYMSPEQARGMEVDARTDVFSIGVVMYEMLAGQSPFAGETTSDVIAAILTTEPKPPSSFNQEIPAELDRIVYKTLAKKRDERYRNAKDLLADLRQLQRRLEFKVESEREFGVTRSTAKSDRSATRNDEATSVSTTEPRNSIAVLPFTNLSSDPENEYFCDGLPEELLNALAKIDQLKVAARTSTFSFKGKNTPVSEIAKALNVKTIMEGSVRKSGNRVRITAQVINAADGYHLWSERYDREMQDIFDVQDEITLAVVDALKVKLFGQEQAAVLKRHTRSAEAHEFYLRGLSYFMRWTPEFFQKAIKSFDQAIAIDSRYASAYAGLAECYTEMSFFAAPREWMPKAREAARQALELDDKLGNAHNSLAVIKMYYDRDYAGAEHEFKRAIALDPGSAHIHNWYGWYLGLMGRFDESLKEMKRAQELDPLSDLIDFAVGAIFHWSRKPEHAIEHHQRVLELNPNFRVVYWFLADAYVEKGDFASAIATIENAPIALNDPVTLSAAGHAYGKAGERRKALEILSELERQSSQEYEPAFHIAQIYLGLGDHEQALAWLEKACDERSVWLIWLGVDPKFDPLRSDPRFKEMLKRLNLTE
jgi:serine/threonine protein kinase/Tfp pilus assembly protein PilF